MKLGKGLSALLGSIILGSIVLSIAGGGHARAAGMGYAQTNLVSNGAVPAAHTDPIDDCII